MEREGKEEGMDEEEINRMEIKEVIKNIKIGKGWNTGRDMEIWRGNYGGVDMKIL